VAQTAYFVPTMEVPMKAKRAKSSKSNPCFIPDAPGFAPEKTTNSSTEA
jgi:hypothetical protein